MSSGSSKKTPSGACGRTPSGGSVDGGVPALSRMVSGYEPIWSPRSSFSGLWLAHSGSSQYFSTSNDAEHGRVTPVTLPIHLVALRSRVPFQNPQGPTPRISGLHFGAGCRFGGPYFLIPQTSDRRPTDKIDRRPATTCADLPHQPPPADPGPLTHLGDPGLVCALRLPLAVVDPSRSRA